MKRPWLLPLVPVYGAGLWMKRQFLEGKPRRLGWPVVSVGSVSAGGAGKTPAVQALAELLEHTGFSVDVLSRGYGRVSNVVGRVDPGGTADEFGDEPLLLSRAGLTVWVGADRFAAGSMAEAASPTSPPVHLLDDGFQHRRLARAFDLVLLTVADVEDRLLPAGDLREPLSRLQAAGLVVLREEEEEHLRPIVRRLTGNVPVCSIRRRLVLQGAPDKAVAFCGIARADSFFSMLRQQGVELVDTVPFSDHHRFDAKDMAHLTACARRQGAQGFLTTEKDDVRLTPIMRARLERACPVHVARLAAEFLEAEEVLHHIRKALEEWSRAAILDGKARSA